MRVCHVVYAYYPFDPRVRKEAFALRDAGHEVHVVCLREGDEPLEEASDGVRVHRVDLRARRGGRGRYAFQYLRFLLLSVARIHRLHRAHPFRVLHVHSLPDFQVFCGALLKARGVRVILDLHEALPEIVAARFRLGPRAPLVVLARAAERLSVGFADRVLTVNETIRGLLVRRGAEARRITVVMNAPDEHVLRVGDAAALRESLALGADPAIVYVGGINPERDLGTLLRAVALLRGRVPLRVVIAGYGPGAYRDRLRTLAHDLRLDGHVAFLPAIPHDRVLTYLSLSVAGVVSYEDSPLTRVAVPNKAFEYAAADKPLVIADLPALRAVFDGAAEFYRPEDAADLARAIDRVIADGAHAAALRGRAASVLRENAWGVMRRRLLDVYGGLAGGPG